ncbi:MAG: hypothetical protein Q8P24_00925 [Desulfobacterales bacterium]|nr:hypothetical protein [Desulfobacterales bacterium]
MSGFIRKIRIAAMAIVLAGAGSSAGAYVLPVPHIVELMTQKLGAAGSLLVSQKLTLYDQAVNQAGVEFNETLRYFFPSGFRSDISSKTTRRIHLVSSGTALTILDGKVDAEVEGRYDLYKDIFYYRSRKQLVERLAFLGIDTFKSSLGRFEGKTVFIVGAQYPDETVSQIWIDKESFMPLRWINVVGSAGGREDALDVRYDKWQQVDKIWYPGHIAFYQHRRLIRKIDVERVQTNVSFSGDLFNIVRLKSSVSRVDRLPQQGAGKAKENEVQKAIEEFRKIYQ